MLYQVIPVQAAGGARKECPTKVVNRHMMGVLVIVLEEDCVAWRGVALNEDHKKALVWGV